MKIVSKKYLIYGYCNPMPFIDLPKIFSENNINFLKSDLFGKCSLRICNNALRSIIHNAPFCKSETCDDCFWGCANKKTDKEKEEAFKYLKNGLVVKFIEDEK